jgi:hypothetical protein
MTDLTTTASKSTKLLAAGLAFVAAAALFFASFSPRWAVLRAEQNGDDGGFGLRQVELCGIPDTGTMDSDPATHCEAAAISSQVDGAFPIFGWIASVAIWIGAGALAAAAILMLLGHFIARPIALTTIAMLGLAVGLISGFVFLALKPSQNFAPGAAFWAFVGGELAGLAATVLVARIRPRDPEWDDPKPFTEDSW